MERGTILWGVAGMLAGFFIAKTFATAEAFGKSIGERGSTAEGIGLTRREMQEINERSCVPPFRFL